MGGSRVLMVAEVTNKRVENGCTEDGREREKKREASQRAGGNRAILKYGCRLRVISGGGWII